MEYTSVPAEQPALVSVDMQSSQVRTVNQTIQLATRPSYPEVEKNIARSWSFTRRVATSRKALELRSDMLHSRIMDFSFNGIMTYIFWLNFKFSHLASLRSPFENRHFVSHRPHVETTKKTLRQRYQQLCVVQRYRHQDVFSHAVLFSDFSLVYILVESYLQLDTCHAHAAARVSSTDSELLLFSGTIAQQMRLFENGSNGQSHVMRHV